MRAPDGRPRGDDTMRSVVKGLTKTDDILARRLSRLPKAPDAPTFPVGIALATASSLDQSNNIGTGQSSIQAADWTFADVSGESLSLSAGAGGYITVGTAGTYRMQPHLNVSWTGGQEPSVLSVSADWDGRSGPYAIWDRSPHPTLHAVRETFPAVEVFLESGQGFWFGANWLNANVCFMDDWVVRVTQLG